MAPRAGARCDWAVILARGDSRRMGRPKGLCRTADDERPLLARVAALYTTREFRLAVVTTSLLRRIYRPILRSGRVHWIVCGGGRGTAASVGAALQRLREEASHLWLHPVDLPFVETNTLAALLARSRREPEAVVVPIHAGRRGHPVILPVAPFARIADRRWPGPMRDQLRRWCGHGPDRLAPLRRVNCLDAGVVRDLDVPDSLAVSC